MTTALLDWLSITAISPRPGTTVAFQSRDDDHVSRTRLRNAGQHRRAERYRSRATANGDALKVVIGNDDELRSGTPRLAACR